MSRDVVGTDKNMETDDINMETGRANMETGKEKMKTAAAKIATGNKKMETGGAKAASARVKMEGAGAEATYVWAGSADAITVFALLLPSGLTAAAFPCTRRMQRLCIAEVGGT